MTAAVPAPRPAPDDADSWGLLAQAQAGDRDAFGQLYRRYQPTLYSYIRWRVHSDQTAQDLAHDVWVRALRSLNRVTYQGSDLGAWLSTIARNMVIDHTKSARHQREHLYAVEPGGPFDNDPADGGDGADAAALDAERAAVVATALARLGGEQRRVLLLRFWAGLSVLETAAAMGISEGACKALQYRAIRAARRLAPELETVR